MSVRGTDTGFTLGRFQYSSPVHENFTIPFHALGIAHIAEAGGKNASLGEMYNQLGKQGIEVPDGFALTAAAYRYFISYNGLLKPLEEILRKLDTEKLENLEAVGHGCRELLRGAQMPPEVVAAIRTSYQQFTARYGAHVSVAVRSSATAEDLPGASFAGQHESFLNVLGIEAVIEACRKCYTSLFNNRAIKYRLDNGFSHTQVALSCGIQKMVRSDLGCSGVAFTIDPESGFQDAIYITGAWGLGENIVQGAVGPDEFLVFKPTLKKGLDPILRRRVGMKEKTMVYSAEGTGTLNTETPAERRAQLVLNDKEVIQLADWCLRIETHYGSPMDIEWAKDGEDGKIYIVQARPETVHGLKAFTHITTYRLEEKGQVLCRGKSVGSKIVSGRACIIRSPDDAQKLQDGDIIVADITNPDWNAMLRKAVSIVTNKGGRTSHASIVARELGIPAVVGTDTATEQIREGQMITVSCADAETGYVYDGVIPFSTQSTALKNISATHTAPMFILANPDKAFTLSRYPNKGVGLLRMEFIINNCIGVHPMALVHFDQLPDDEDKRTVATRSRAFADKQHYFTDTLARSVAQVAAAFYPREVIVRMSDFKSNEYASLLCGKHFEPGEENPMIGFRGASRYYHPRYREGFGLECRAMKYVREHMGLTNVKLMIPFCRTVEEAVKVLEVMQSFGLRRGESGLEIYMMVEIPSNVILAEAFAAHFDGFSIGSNDLTQLTLGIDRDSAIISDIFNERNEAALWMISTAIRKAKAAGIKIGLCGQAPSDYPEFASLLVQAGIDSISFTPDALLKGIENIAEAEKALAPAKPDTLSA